MRVDHPNQGLVRHSLVADAERQVGDRSIGWGEDPGLVELPLQIRDFSRDCLYRRLVQRLGLALLVDSRLGIVEVGLGFLRRGRRRVQPLARQEPGRGDRFGTR
jgi:hypothetical protein